jgi:thiol-disulfide isomerase/thioredoxin
MKNLFHLLYFKLVGLILFSNTLYAQSPIKVVIKGSIENRTETHLFVNSLMDHILLHGDSIQVVNGHFEYEMEVYPQLPYRLVFGSEREVGQLENVVQFFIDSDTIHFYLRESAPIPQHRVNGGNLNNAHGRYLSIYEKQVLNPTMLHRIAYQAIQKNTQLSEEEKNVQGSVIFKELEALRTQWIQWQFNEFIPQDQSVVALASQYEYYNGLEMLPEAVSYIQNTLEGSLVALHSNPLYIQLSQLVNQKEVLVVGGKWPEMILPELNGSEQSVTPWINSHKLTLINLWGTWCAPCLTKSIELNPLHHAYKDKGFGVIGIAWEYGNTKQLEHVIKRQQFDWHHLVDLNASQQVWSRLGIQSIGKMILVDQEGTILAIDPSQQQLQKWLETM